jgi:hypothetical protein
MNGMHSLGARRLLWLLLILALPGLACGALSGDEEGQDKVSTLVEGEMEEVPAVDSAQVDVQAPDGEAALSPQEDDNSRAPISGALRPSGVVDAVRVTVTTEHLDTGDTSVSTAVFVQPDSYMLADDTIDTIIVDGKSYARNEEGNYEETFDMSFIVGGLVANLIDPWGTEAGLAMATFSAPEGGPETLDDEDIRGVTTHGYEYQIPLPEVVSEAPILYRIWIGANDELAYRQQIEHPTEKTLSTIEFEYEGVEIVAPGS